MSLVFLHGLESGPHGSKFRALTDKFGPVLAPDFQGIMDLDTRLQVAADAIQGHQDVVLVGSSFGGLVAAILASRSPSQVKGMVLCAPALHRPGADLVLTMPSNTVILHGVQDDVVPVSFSRSAAQHFGVRLVTVDDDHRLKGANALLCDLVGQVIAKQA